MKLDTKLVIIAVPTLIITMILTIWYQNTHGAFDKSSLASPIAEELIMQDFEEPEPTVIASKVVKQKKTSPKAIIDGVSVPVKIMHTKSGKFESTLIYINKEHLDVSIGIATYSTSKNHGFVTITPEQNHIYIAGIPADVIKKSKTINIQLTTDTTIVIITK